jgi:chromosome segregation ATPase
MARSENEELQNVINSLEADSASAKSDLEQVSAQQKQTALELSEANAKIDDLIDASTTEKALLQADIDDKAASIESSKQEIDSLHQIIEASNADFMENITAARKELDEEVAKQIARAARAEAEIAKVNAQADALKSRLELEIAGKNAEIKQAAEVRITSETVLAQVKKELQLSQDEVYKKDGAIEGLKVNVDGLKAENLNFKTEAKAVQDELGGFKAGAGGDINVLRLEIETQKKNVDRRGVELEAAQHVAVHSQHQDTGTVRPEGFDRQRKDREGGVGSAGRQGADGVSGRDPKSDHELPGGAQCCIQAVRILNCANGENHAGI